MIVHHLPEFVAATGLLILIPGPNVALIVANSIAHGRRYGLLTVGGTLTAMAIQLLLNGIGMTALLAAAGSWFEWIRWIGAAYLVFLGIRQWRAPTTNIKAPSMPKSPRALYGRAVLVGLTNPKTLFFYGAFFPQFVVAGRNPTGQIAVLSLVFLLVALILDGGWALAASRARKLLTGTGRLRHRLSGGILIGAGATLALARPK